MESMLKEILEAEKAAREAANEAEKYKAEAIAETEEEKKRIISERLAEAQAEVERLRKEHHENVTNTMKVRESRSQDDISAMLALDKKMHDTWVSDIFNKVISNEE